MRSNGSHLYGPRVGLVDSSRGRRLAAAAQKRAPQRSGRLAVKSSCQRSCDRPTSAGVALRHQTVPRFCSISAVSLYTSTGKHTQHFHHNLQLHRTITLDAAPMTHYIIYFYVHCNFICGLSDVIIKTFSQSVIIDIL